MSAKLIVHPKDYKLKCSEEVLKNLKPYFELRSSSYSHYSHSQAPQITNNESASAEHKPTESKPIQEAKTNIHLILRDTNSGELIGKGNLILDHTQERPEKFEEKVILKGILGHEVGEAILEIHQVKPQQPPRAVEDEFRRMRKELTGMMRATNRLFDSFSRRHFGRDWGFGLLDDFSPMMMLGDDYDDGYDEHETKGNVCDKCHGHGQVQHGGDGASRIEQLQNHSAPIVELAQNANEHTGERRSEQNCEKKSEVEITSEKVN